VSRLTRFRWGRPIVFQRFRFRSLRRRGLHRARYKKIPGNDCMICFAHFRDILSATVESLFRSSHRRSAAALFNSGVHCSFCLARSLARSFAPLPTTFSFGVSGPRNSVVQIFHPFPRRSNRPVISALTPYQLSAQSTYNGAKFAVPPAPGLTR
jgi:hypothetical protein